MASVLVRRALVQALRLKSTTNILNLSHNSVRCFCLSTKAHAKRYFSEKHEWVNVENGHGTVGITSYAQDKLGEIVYAQISPEVGTEVQNDAEIGVLESVKAASEVYCPVSGEVVEVNDEVAENPKLVNDSPHDKGWLIKLKLSNLEELEVLMDEDSYKKYTETLE